MLSVFRNMFRIRDLRNKILFTLFIFAIYRLGAAVPSPGVDIDAVKAFTDQAQNNGLLGIINLFSGGALETMSVFALGIMPYITASIIMQLLAVVIPRLQSLQEEGEAGRKVITQWTRYLTVALALLQSTGITFLFTTDRFTGTGIILIPEPSLREFLLVVITLTAGTAVIMWMGELITQRGVGNGMSLIIFVSIVSQLPSQFALVQANALPLEFAFILVLMLALTVGIIFMDQGQRRIPIQFSRRVRGRKVLGGQSTYIPLKVNQAGVIPVIFATSIMYFPVLVTSALPSTGWGAAVQSWVDRNLLQSGSGGFSPTLPYILILGLLVVFFTYFYTAIQFDPERQAETIQRQGGFIPGIRPGRATVKHLEHVLSRITLPGSLYLAIVAIAPSLAGFAMGIPVGLSGVSILIVAGVALETMKQIESQLMMRNYEGFLS
jgi:preprotein translocase subunit SecY